MKAGTKRGQNVDVTRWCRNFSHTTAFISGICRQTIKERLHTIVYTVKTGDQYFGVVFAMLARGQSCSSHSSDGRLQLQNHLSYWYILIHTYVHAYISGKAKHFNHLQIHENDLLFLLHYFQHQPDLAIGVHLMDRYTFYLLEFLEDIHPASKTSMNDLVRVLARMLVPSYLIWVCCYRLTVRVASTLSI